jgi:hypothetical protein
MNSAMEMMFVRQMMGGESWVHAVFLAGLFAVILFRRDQIVSPYTFRVSVILFVLSFILPIVVTSMVQQMGRAGRPGFIGSPDAGTFFQVIALGVGPFLFGLRVLLCILSMLPPWSRYPQPPSRPQEPHPLD